MEYMEQQMQNFIEAGISEADRCYARIAELEQQNAALAAQVEALRKALDYADNKLYILTHNREDVSERLLGDADKAFKVVRDTLSQTATPQQHLAEVKAQAGRAGFVAGYMLCNDGSPLIKHNYEGFADKYAETIRQEVK